MLLQSLREKFTGWLGLVIFGSLGLLMAVAFGVGNYTVGHSDTWVAKVGKHKISQQDFRDQMNRLREQKSNQQGDQFDASEFEKPEVKKKVVDGMIDRYLLQQSADKLGLVVTRNEVRQRIGSIPAFQVNGTFDPDTYRAVLANQRMTPVGFQKKVHSELATQLLPGAISSTSTLGQAEVEAYLKLQLQTRDLKYVVLSRPALEDTKVSKDEVSRYYQKHQDQFMRPEQVAVNYIELDASKMHLDENIDEDSLRARYAQNKSRYVEPSQRLVSHILIKVPDNATPAQQKKALAKAKKVDSRAHAKDADFAALARKYSDDAGSARQGGKLGWLEKGVTNKAFQDAMFKMHKGEISQPVLTSDGYEIIWLRGVRKGKVKPFSEVRDQLLAQAKDADREHQYSKVAGKLTDLVYQDPSTLKPAAKKLGLKVQSTDLFSRKGGKKGLAADPKVVKAAFSDNVLKDDNTSDPITLGANHMVVVHVARHVKSKVRPLASVRDKIRQKILDQRVDALGKKQADAAFAALKKSRALDQVAKAHDVQVRKLDGVERRQQGVSQTVLDKAFAMPHPKKKGQSSLAMTSLGHGSYALLSLDAVHPGDLDKIKKAQRQMLLQQMRQAYATAATNEWVKFLRGKAGVKVLQKNM